MDNEHPILVYTGTTTSSYGYGSGDEAEENSFFGARSRSVFSYSCPYCRCDGERQHAETTWGVTGWHEDTFARCTICGWWSYKSEGDNTDGIPEFHSVAALLKEFAAASPDVPIEALAAHISKRPETIHSMSPAKLEEVVGSIYSELFGYRVEYCSYARPDRGIDLVVVKSESDTLAIQVKRQRRPVELGIIHQFFGAMVSADRKEGVFLTTGRFRAGAKAEASVLSSKTSVNISLVDGRRFLEFIGVLNSRRRKPTANDYPFWRAHPYFGQTSSD